MRAPTPASAAHTGPLRPLDLGVLVATLILPILAAARVAPTPLRPWLAGWIVLASLVTYILYHRDKTHARLGTSRTPESMLHGWSLAGGWPGAWIAQRRLRHKTAKFRFQLVHWTIVAAYNYAALELLLGGRLMRSGFGALRRLFTAAST